MFSGSKPNRKSYRYQSTDPLFDLADVEADIRLFRRLAAAVVHRSKLILECVVHQGSADLRSERSVSADPPLSSG